jgi:ferric-dicitrate binding protein FerR (iron transport regulator)
MNKNKNINWGKIAKYLDQEMDNEEQEAFEKIIQSDQEYNKLISSVQKMWNETKNKQNMIEVNTDSAWEKLKNRIENQKSATRQVENIRKSSYRKMYPAALRVAAVIIIAAGLSFVIFKSFISPRDSADRQLTFRSEPDRMMQTTLPDGSIVHIKANSVISYERKETGTRELALKGEAFFEITHDPDQPFIISTDQALVKVIGTSFSVQADNDNKTVNVYVESGLVELTNKLREDPSMLIEPGYIGILTENGIEKKINENENYLSWKTGKLEFRETCLSEVIADLNHTYGTNIIFGNPEVAECHFTGTFLNHQPVDTVLEVLKTAFNLDIERMRSDIILSGDGCKSVQAD